MNKYNKVAIVCCYNNSEILEEMLENSIEYQDYSNIERIYSYNQFKSAAEAYNNAIMNSDAEYFVFVHQDIKFESRSAISEIVSFIEESPGALFGLCGARRLNNVHKIYSNVFHGLQNRIVGEKISHIQEVEGLDEILLACHKDIFKRILYDQITFDGWHLFVEDLCLQAIENNIPIYVLPIKAQHKNSLEMPRYIAIYNIYPKEFYIYLHKLYIKHRTKIDAIVCPCIMISTQRSKYIITMLKVLFKSGVQRKLRKWSLK